MTLYLNPINPLPDNPRTAEALRLKLQGMVLDNHQARRDGRAPVWSQAEIEALERHILTLRA